MYQRICWFRLPPATTQQYCRKCVNNQDSKLLNDNKQERGQEPRLPCHYYHFITGAHAVQQTYMSLAMMAASMCNSRLVTDSQVRNAEEINEYGLKGTSTHKAI